MSQLSRRELLALGAAAPLVAQGEQKLPTAPVSVAKCASFQEDVTGIMARMFDEAGVNALVKNKTVTVKLNLTGSPGLRFKGKALGSTHYTHPKTIAATIALLDKAGAKRIRLVESCWGTAAPLEEYMLDCGWNVRAFQQLSKRLEFENTNARGSFSKYAEFKVPKGGEIFPSFTLNKAFEETDLLMSMAKLKNHATCGITLSMKNCFGNTPASIYGDDAGLQEPNERPTKGRGEVCHVGSRNPSLAVAQKENDAKSPRIPEHRMPRISVEVVAARPVDIAFIEGVETINKGEGPWCQGIEQVKPGVMILGTNMVSTDAVGAAIMGYNPRAQKGEPPFQKCENMLLIAESYGLGTADLSKIEVRGESIEAVKFPYPESV